MKTILIADCDKSFCSNLCEYLKHHKGDISVLTAGNTAEAIAILQTNHIDLLIADINMQPEKGPDLMSFVTSSYPDLPVYATTEFMDMKTYKRLNALEVYDYIIKPYDLQDLIGNVVHLFADDKPGLEKARIRSWFGVGSAT